MGFERIRAFEDHIVATVEDVGMPSRIQSIADRGRYRLAIELIQEGLVIVGVDLGRATDHEQKDDRFGARCKVWGSRGMGIERIEIPDRSAIGALCPDLRFDRRAGDDS